MIRKGACKMKKILFVYPSMILGGSTTSLLSLLNCIDPKKYEIDLQMQSNSGPLFKDIPSHVNILPSAQKYKGHKGKLAKIVKIFTSGTLFKLLLICLKKRKLKFSPDIIADFWVKSLSVKNEKHYDFAIGFLEGWSNRFVAHNVTADKKYAWIHSTFANVTDNPEAQTSWMNQVDKVVFVNDACTQDFKKTMPEMAGKAVTVENITDDALVLRRSEMVDFSDEAYIAYKEAKCFKIITVCRIILDVKGLDRIVLCAKQLKKMGKTFLWYIVGNGSDEDKFREMIINEGIQDVLVPIGKRLNPYPFIKEADIMCMPSRYEGKPMVVTESLILGVPPVVTEYLSARDQINDMNDGLVVENNDYAIIRAVEECIENPSKVKAMKGAALCKKYGNKEYISEMEILLFE